MDVSGFIKPPDPFWRYWAEWTLRPLYWVITWPLEQLYLRGYWRGRSLPEICSGLAPIHGDAVFWYSQPVACAALIGAHFDSYAVWIYMAIYWMLAAILIRRILKCTFFADERRTAS